MAHVLGETSPVVDEDRGVLLIASKELIVDDGGKDAAELFEAMRAS
jgi:hypothetical protein